MPQGHVLGVSMQQAPVPIRSSHTFAMIQHLSGFRTLESKTSLCKLALVKPYSPIQLWYQSTPKYVVFLS